MFYKLVLDNFKCFDHFEIDLKEGKTKRTAKKLVLIYGENGIGKSSLIDAFKLLRTTSNSLIKLSNLNNSLALDELDDELSIDFINASRKSCYISYIIKNLQKIGSNGPMKIKYFCYDANGASYEYEMVFDTDSIIAETLSCNNKLIYSIDKNDYVHFITSNDELCNKLKEYKDMYFGKHTFLSCIKILLKDFVAGFIKSFTDKKILKFITLVSNFDIFRPADYKFEKFAFIENDDLVENLVSGRYTERIAKQLENTKKALSNYFSSLYKNIEKVNYVIKEIGNKKKYELVFVEKTKNKTIKVPYQLESTGTKKIVALYSYFYEVLTNRTIGIIDEIDSGIGDNMLKNIINSLPVDNFKGQLIMTTHNAQLMNNSLKKNIYLIVRNDDFSVTSLCLDSFGRKIQPNTDVTGKYYSNDFGGTTPKAKEPIKII